MVTPAVSVAIRAFRRRWLAEAVASVLDQAETDLELVVYDDAGGLQDVVDRFADPRVRYHRAAGRTGPAGRFRAALARCRGRFLGVLDDDDVYAPAFVARLRAALEDHPEVGIAYCRAEFLEEDGTRSVPSDDRPAGPDPHLLEHLVTGRLAIAPSQMLVRREAMGAAMALVPMPDDVGPDLFLNVHAAATGWGHWFVDETLVTRRFHAAQLSRDGVRALDLSIRTLASLRPATPGLEALRRRTQARRVLRRALERLAGGDRAGTLGDTDGAHGVDPGAFPLVRRLLCAAARLPGLGPLAARSVLRLPPVHARSHRPPACALQRWP